MGSRTRGYTLIEICLCLGLLVLLSTAGLISAGYVSKVNGAREASAILQQVENARMSYLADNPSLSYSDLSLSVITNYMSDPSLVANLQPLGYALSDPDIQSYPMAYGIIPGSGAIPLSGWSTTVSAGHQELERAGSR